MSADLVTHVAFTEYIKYIKKSLFKSIWDHVCPLNVKVRRRKQRLPRLRLQLSSQLHDTLMQVMQSPYVVQEHGAHRLGWPLQRQADFVTPEAEEVVEAVMVGAVVVAEAVDLT